MAKTNRTWTGRPRVTPKEVLKRVSLGIITDRKALQEFRRQWRSGFRSYSVLNTLIMWATPPETRVPAWRDDQPYRKTKRGRRWLLDREGQDVTVPTAERATLCAGLKAWRDKHKRAVTAGSVGIRILAPTRVKVEDKVDAMNEAVNGGGEA